MNATTENKTPAPSLRRVCADGPTMIAFSMTLIMTIGVAGVTPVLPSIMKEFSVTTAEVAWVIAIFTLPSVFILPLVGMLADRYGRKPVLFPTLILFALGGIACATAQSFTALLFWRFLQGLGSTALGFLPSVMLADRYQKHELTSVMGYNSAVLSAGTALAPALGGLSGAVHWRFSFLLSLLALLPLAVAFMVKLAPGERSGDMKSYWRTSWEAMRNKYTIMLFALGFLTFMMLYGVVITCLPVMQESKFAATPTHIGLLAMCMSLSSCVAAAFLGRLTRRFSMRSLLVVSQCCYAAALLAMPFVPGLWMFVLPLLFYGFGQGINTPLIGMLQVSRAPVEQKAAIMSTHSMLMRLAQSVAPVSFALVYHKISPSAAFFCATGVALLMVLISTLTPAPKKSKERPDK